MCHQNKYTYCLPNTLILPCFEGLTPAIAILFAGVVSSLSASLVISKLNVVTNNEVHAAHFQVHISILSSSDCKLPDRHKTKTNS